VATTLLWHPQVHTHFNETLYYCLINPRSPSGGFLDDLRTALETLDIGGRCVYEVFGESDYLIRVWMNPTAAAQLFKFFDDYRLQSLGVFRVSEHHHWAFPHRLPEAGVRGIRPEDVRRAQELDPAVIPRLTAFGACAEADTNQGIKFFIAVPPPPRWEVPALELLRRALMKGGQHDGIIHESAYFGDGFTWGLVKGVAKDFFSIRARVRAVNAEIAPFLIKTATLICSEPHPDEAEIISHTSLTLWQSPPDPVVLNWIADLYEHPDLEFRRRMEDWVRRVLADRDSGGITEKDEETLHDYLLGVIGKDTRRASQPLLYWFLTVEAGLREAWERVRAFRQRNEDGFESSKAYASCKIDNEHQIGLGGLLCLFVASKQALGLTAGHDTQLTIERIVKLRNSVVHGREGADVVERWQQHIETLVNYLRLHRTIAAGVEKLAVHGATFDR
jgi:hypothetical protein